MTTCTMIADDEGLDGVRADSQNFLQMRPGRHRTRERGGQAQMVTKVTKLKLARVGAGLTQLALANEAGVTTTLLSLAERGLIDVAPEQRVALARVLGVSPASLLRPVTPPARPSPTSQLAEAK